VAASVVGAVVGAADGVRAGRVVRPGRPADGPAAEGAAAEGAAAEGEALAGPDLEGAGDDEALGAADVGVALGDVDVGGLVGVGFGVGVDLGPGFGVGFGVGEGAGAACTGAASAGVRRAEPCCQARATAPPSGTWSPPTPREE
jgi:hypothetical protein